MCPSGLPEEQGVHMQSGLYLEDWLRGGGGRGVLSSEWSAGCRPRAEQVLQVKCKGHWLQNPPSLQTAWPSADWTRPTHPGQGNLLHSRPSGHVKQRTTASCRRPVGASLPTRQPTALFYVCFCLKTPNLVLLAH